MAFDPSHFSSMVVIDTCAVWNVLSSKKLFRSAIAARVSFCLTPMILYECIYKKRKVLTTQMIELIERFNTARANRGFEDCGCDIDNLLSVSRQAPSGLSSGELSCIATAYEIPSLAFMTDEKKARRYAEEILKLKVETTAKMYGWLHFKGHLTDWDHKEIVIEHETYERRPISKFLEDAYIAALEYRAMGK